MDKQAALDMVSLGQFQRASWNPMGLYNGAIGHQATLAAQGKMAYGA